MNANNQAILNLEIESLLQKAVIEPVPFAQRLQGFYSTFFLVPKKSGDLRAVINLRPLNQYLKTQHFKMDTLKTVLNLVKKDDWAISIDLKDAYFHVLIHPKHRKYLRFCIQGRAFQFTSFRSQNLAESFYKDSGSGCSSSKNAKHQIGCIPGRLVSSECKEKISPGEQGSYSQSSFSTRLLDKQRKIKPGPYPRYNIHRREVLLRQGYCHAYSRENSEIKTCSHSFAGRKSVSKAVFTNSRPDGFLHRNYTKCKVTNETYTTSPVVLVETGIQRPRNDHSQVTSFERASELVVTGSQHCQGQIFVSNSSQQNDCHRCVHSDVGRESGSSDHTGFWSEEQKELHINCLELEAVILTIKNFLPQLRNQCVLVRSDNTTVIQYICSQGGTRSPQLCYKTWDLWQLAIKNNIILKAAHIAGKLNILPDQLSRIVIRPTEWTLNDTVLRKIFSDLGSSNNRSLCIVSQQEDGHLLHLGPSSPGVRCRCVFGDMESNVCVCIPTNLPDSQSFGTHEAGTLSGNFDSSSMAKKTLVSGSTAVVHCKSNQVTSNTQSLESTKHDYISSGSQGVQSECMVTINRQLSANGFSQKVRNLLSASWRAGTQKDYSGKFKQFSSWCRGKQIDTYSASLTD